MSEDRPLWRQGFDAVESRVGPVLKTVVGSEQFAIAAGILARLQKTVQVQTERSTRRALHQWNLPAGSDVTRILAEIGKLQGQMRELTREVNTLKEGGDRGQPDDDGRASRSRQTRR